MADKPRPPQTDSTRRRRHEAPTIDLSAAEVPPGQSGAAAAADAAVAGAGRRMPFNPTALVAGAAGAAATGFVLLGLWYGGILQVPDANQRALRNDIASLQSQVEALRNQPSRAAEPDAVAALRARLDTVAADVARRAPQEAALAEQLAALDSAVKSLNVALAALDRRGEDIAANVRQALAQAAAAETAVRQLDNGGGRLAKMATELQELQQRVAALERSTGTSEGAAKPGAVDMAARLALSAATLRDAVERGAPFAAELQQVKTLGADATLLAPLARFASEGVPSRQQLARELEDLLPSLARADADGAAPAGFLERLQSSASRLVRIRPIEAPAGDEPATVLARLEVEAAKADIDAALADLNRLPGRLRAPAQAWIDKAQTRAAALAAARDLVVRSARALGAP
ncbi:MAG: hypothetical protein IRY89_02235 [Pseudolabrys sp.]|nr:hypothetical protein [Pseudolabrys sp.]